MNVGLLLLLSNFGYYFPGQTSALTTKNQQIISSEKNLYALDCVFSVLTSSNYGGAIYFYGSNFYILIESCLFDGCSSVNGGGAVFVQMSIGTVFAKVCAYKCYSNGYGQFADLCAANSAKNDLITSTMACCSTSLTGRQYSVYIHTGSSLLEGFNSSSNTNYDYAGVHFLYLTNPHVSLSTFKSNFAQEIVIGIRYCSCLFENCNIVNNTASTWGVFYSGASSTTIEKCILSANTGSLFSIDSGGSYSITNNWIHHQGTTSQNGVTKTYPLTHFIGGQCEGDIKVSTLSQIGKNNKTFFYFSLYYLLVNHFLFW